MKKGVVYTCLVGGYDEITNLSYASDDFDYVCFTDNIPENPEKYVWDFRPIVYSKLDPVRNNRWHKVHPHLLFPEYDESIYIDANIDILDVGFFDDIRKVRKMESSFSLGPHFARKNLFDEFDACESLGKDDVGVMREQRKLIEESGFLGDFGVFFENNIIYRRHNDEKVKKIMGEWWWWIENHSRRDQLSLTYVLWKNDFHADVLSDVSYRRQASVRFVESRNHVTKEELRKRCDDFRAQVKEMSVSVSSLRSALKDSEQELRMIKDSKFWKLRDLYMKLKGK